MSRRSMPHPDDFTDGAPERVFGSETEYTTGAIENDLVYNACLSHFTPVQFTLSVGRSALQSIITSNGGELYVDSGNVLEYATPECTSPLELLAHERAGEEFVVATAINAAADTMQPKDVFKRSGYTERDDDNSDFSLEEMSTGHHENYFTYLFSEYSDWSRPYVKDLSSTLEFHSLVSFLATRAIWAGTGMLTESGYTISQKATAIDYTSLTSLVNHGSKMPLGFHEDNRLEIRSGEGNMSDWAVLQKFALTSLVIRLIEHNKFPSSLIVKDPNLAALDMSLDPYAKTVQLEKERISAVEHQRRIIETAYDFLTIENSFSLPKYEEEAVYEFDRFVKDFRASSLVDNDVCTLSDRVDWAAKFDYLNRRGIRYKDMTVQDINQLYHDLRWETAGEKGPARKWFKKNKSDLVDAETIQRALSTPPHTRARKRVNAIKQLQYMDEVSEVEWDMVYGSSSNGKDKPMIHLYDPFDGGDVSK